MSIKPILFSGPMVQAIRAGRKTMTRRVAKELNGVCMHNCRYVDGDIQEPIGYPAGHISVTRRAPYQTGDILWVRETWRKWTGGYSYKADAPAWACMWRPSIHMPKAAARIFLLVTDVRVERVQDISGEDCIREGVEIEALSVGEAFTRGIFNGIWDSINAKRGYGWDSNPWVWAYTFERCERPEGWMV